MHGLTCKRRHHKKLRVLSRRLVVSFCCRHLSGNIGFIAGATHTQEVSSILKLCSTARQKLSKEMRAHVEQSIKHTLQSDLKVFADLIITLGTRKQIKPLKIIGITKRFFLENSKLRKQIREPVG